MICTCYCGKSPLSSLVNIFGTFLVANLCSRLEILGWATKLGLTTTWIPRKFKNTAPESHDGMVNPQADLHIGPYPWIDSQSRYGPKHGFVSPWKSMKSYHYQDLTSATDAARYFMKHLMVILHFDGVIILQSDRLFLTKNSYFHLSPWYKS